ncbi:hypothetical protein LSAT2_015554, partial [Lamellibrachia satsuma]
GQVLFNAYIIYQENLPRGDKPVQWLDTDLAQSVPHMEWVFTGTVLLITSASSVCL